MLADAGLERVDIGARSLLTAYRWRPAWLEDDALAGIDAVEPRRLRPRAPEADVFFQDSTHYEWYATEGQQIAARCIELSPDGSTILVSLPTGVGKSVVGLFGALKPAAKGTTVVVVPTISLARDQEVHLQSALERGEIGRSLRHRDFAYLGGTSDVVKDEIRQRIRSGEQGVVFLGPESLLGLAPALAEAAYQGRLVDFVVDEAHAVLGWGADFRPDFQTIAGVRRGLLDACPEGLRFRTILLSATITEYAAEVLGRLFGAPSSNQQPAAPRYLAVEGLLRPEPSYYIVGCFDEAERRSRLLDALFHMPRPAIVYVTRPGAAEELLQAARGAGFTRLASYTGGSSAREREAVETGWRGSSSARTKIDVVIATSAFGLGIDQPDVRAVIHAFTPETASRYYQEVGRGGRDGRACISLLLTTPTDQRLCRNLAQRTYPREKVRPRWQSMFEHRVAVAGDTRFWVDLDDVRPELRGRGVRPGQQRNRSWNQRVLTLLQDASLIELDTPPSVRPPVAFQSPVGLRLSRADMYETEWDEAWESARRRGFADAVGDFDTMQGILRRDRCVAEWFADQFAIHVDEGLRRPAVACAGCPWCRGHGHPAWVDRPWTAAAASGVADVAGPRLDGLLAVAPERVLAVVAEPAQRPKAVAGALRAAVEYGVIFATNTSLRTAPFVTERRDARPGLADESRSTGWHGLPGTIEVIDGAAAELEESAFQADGALFRIIVVPPDAPDPANPHRSVAEMRSIPVLFADQFLSLIG